MILRFFLAFVLAATLIGGEAFGRAESAAEIVARMRESLGLAKIREAGAMRLAGRTTFLRREATFEFIFDAEGRSRFEIKGPLGATYGFDGATAWTRDFGGEIRRESLCVREDLILRSLILTGLAFGEGSGLAFDEDPEHSSEKVASLKFRFKDGIRTGWVAIDREKWRPMAWVLDGEPTPGTWQPFTWVSVRGVMFAMHIKTGSEYSFHGDLEFNTIERFVPEAGCFDMPAVKYDDTRFDPLAPNTPEVKRARSGQLLLKASIDGGPEGWFLLDTKVGGTALDAGFIKAHEFVLLGEVATEGGERPISAPLLRARSLRVGPMTIDGPLFLGHDMAQFSEGLGVDVQGILGYGLLARCVAEIDMATPVIRLHDPRTFALEKGGWRPLTLVDKAPAIAGSIKGDDGLFMLDTFSANLILSVHAPSVRRLGLLEGIETEPGDAHGIGGPVKGRVGVLKSFELAGIPIQRQVVEFATERLGPAAEVVALGTVGGRVIAAFLLVLDYQRDRAAMILNQPMPPAPAPQGAPADGPVG